MNLPGKFKNTKNTPDNIIIAERSNRIPIKKDLRTSEP
ncbi:MAG: hypothetical protein IGBAC_1294 [Ignavibacteriae bacterium]|nr:MAG: hypothetical protein IGBAC_1294 [Ignavibacteriota bacterium]